MVACRLASGNRKKEESCKKLPCLLCFYFSVFWLENYPLLSCLFSILCHICPHPSLRYLCMTKGLWSFVIQLFKPQKCWGKGPLEVSQSNLSLTFSSKNICLRNLGASIFFTKWQHLMKNLGYLQLCGPFNLKPVPPLPHLLYFPVAMACCQVFHQGTSTFCFPLFLFPTTELSSSL